MRLMMLACTVGAILMALPVSATVRYCAPEPLGNDANDGLTPDTPKTFSYSAGHLSSDDELRILKGTYKPATGSLGSHIFSYTGPVSLCGWDKDKSAPADPKDVIIDLEANNGLIRTVRGIVIRNLTVLNAKASSYPGGAIDLASNPSYYDEPAVVSNCIFKTSSAGSHSGGAIAAERPSTIMDCYFEGNTNNTDGGALYLKASSKAVGCTFVGNRSAGMGGAIMSTGSQIVGCVFSNNYAKSFGGAIYGSADYLRGCTIVSNLSDNCGGAYAWGGTAVVVLDECVISNNVQTAKGNWACGGGALALNASGGCISLTNCTIVSNKSACQGGAVLMRYAKLFEAFGCTFAGNYADGRVGESGYITQGGPGSVLWINSPVDGATNRFEGCTFRNNRWNPDITEDKVSGGVVCSSAGTAILKGCTFERESGSAKNIFQFGGSDFSSVEDCTFASITNSRTRKSCTVAAVGAACAVKNCVFADNNADLCGLSTGGSATTTNAYLSCTFARNYSWQNSLVSTKNDAFLQVEDCTFEDNVLNDGFANTSGGICICAGGKVAIDRCSFVNNTNDVYTGANGGAVYLYSTSASDEGSHVRNCLFAKNGCGWHVSRFGSAIFLASASTLAIPIENCTFVNQLYKKPVQYSGGESWSEKNLVNCAFAGNAANQGMDNADHCWEGTLADAKFTDAANGDYCPTNGSPLVNAGLNASWMIGARDLLNSPQVPRIINDVVDIGCYEFCSTRGMMIFVR